MKARYLAFYSYIGTGFRSSEKIWLKEGKTYPDPESVQGLLEIGLKKFRPLNYPHVILSSRTDGGVHALNTSAHFDLERFGTKIYDPTYIVHTLNKFFLKSNINILMRQCLRVNDNFNARYNAIGRTYLYRLAVLKKDVVLPEFDRVGSYIPIEELRKCHFMRNQNFDIEPLKEASKYFIGIHDFTTFKKFNKLRQYKHNRRQIFDIEVRPGRPIVTSLADKRHEVFDYWDIVFKGRSFVHNQIRRMMGTLITVAIGKLPPEDIKLMLQIPSKHSWHHAIQNCPPDGLYLAKVEYRPEDLIYSDNISANIQRNLDDNDVEDDKL